MEAAAPPGAASPLRKTDAFKLHLAPLQPPPGAWAHSPAAAAVAPLPRQSSEPRLASDADSDLEEEEGNDWVAVPMATVDAWRVAAHSGEALRHRGLSLDHALSVAAQIGAAGNSLGDKMSALRVVASCGDLEELNAPLAPPVQPPQRAPPAPPSASVATSQRCAVTGRPGALRRLHRGAPRARARGAAFPLEWRARAAPRARGCRATADELRCAAAAAPC
jgi:hypothetical protein